MNSLKFSDAQTERGKKLRVLVHTINVFVVSFIFITLVNRVGVVFGVDVSMPLREYDKLTVLSGLALMFALFVLLYSISFKFLSWIFKKFRI